MASNGEIIIRFEEGAGSKPKVDPTGEDKKSENTVLNTALLIWAAKKAATLIKNVTINEAKYQLNMHYKMTDNYIGQQNMDIALSVAEKSVSAVTSIVGGALAGAKLGGAPGAVIGAVIGVGGFGITTALQISHNYEQERIRLRQMDAQLQFNRQRAGYSLTAGSVGENR